MPGREGWHGGGALVDDACHRKPWPRRIHSRNGSAWARAFYDMRRQQGHRHHAILRALAFKWIRIIFRCWKDRTLYSEQKYIHQLRKQNSPILKFIPITT